MGYAVAATSAGTLPGCQLALTMLVIKELPSQCKCSLMRSMLWKVAFQHDSTGAGLQGRALDITHAPL
jgi:hypothetical protein